LFLGSSGLVFGKQRLGFWAAGAWFLGSGGLVFRQQQPVVGLAQLVPMRVAYRREPSHSVAYITIQIASRKCQYIAQYVMPR
jgi:hypothetical protein